VTVAATIYGVPDGASYDYTITLTNTSSVALNSFWYGWTTSGDNLPSAPASAGNSVSWGNGISGNSIKWTNSTGTALAPGASATFTFVSSDTPSAITTAPSGESVVYVGAIDFSQGTAGDSSQEFSPTLVSAPVSNSPPVLAVAADITGSGAGATNWLVLAWPTNNAGITLQSTTNLFAPTVWADVSTPPVIVNGQYTVSNIISGAQQFFRLANQ
jgi:hypothetical protein